MNKPLVSEVYKNKNGRAWGILRGSVVVKTSVQSKLETERVDPSHLIKVLVFKQMRCCVCLEGFKLLRHRPPANKPNKVSILYDVNSVRAVKTSHFSPELAQGEKIVSKTKCDGKICISKVCTCY